MNMKKVFLLVFLLLTVASLRSQCVFVLEGDTLKYGSMYTIYSENEAYTGLFYGCDSLNIFFSENRVFLKLPKKSITKTKIADSTFESVTPVDSVKKKVISRYSAAIGTCIIPNLFYDYSEKYSIPVNFNISQIDVFTDYSALKIDFDVLALFKSKRSSYYSYGNGYSYKSESTGGHLFLFSLNANLMVGKLKPDVDFSFYALAGGGLRLMYETGTYTTYENFLESGYYKGEESGRGSTFFIGGINLGIGAHYKVSKKINVFLEVKADNVFLFSFSGFYALGFEMIPIRAGIIF